MTKLSEKSLYLQFSRVLYLFQQMLIFICNTLCTVIPLYQIKGIESTKMIIGIIHSIPVYLCHNLHYSTGSHVEYPSPRYEYHRPYPGG